jgi:hypothetical protein
LLDRWSPLTTCSSICRLEVGSELCLCCFSLAFTQTHTGR